MTREPTGTLIPIMRPMRWMGDRLLMLDQRLLPQREVWLELRSADEVANAIRDMAVRGAPAIGIAAAYAMVLAALKRESLEDAAAALAATRPTAVNLVWALKRMAGRRDPADAEREARAIEDEDLRMNREIGRRGAELLPADCRVLTLCNTGALATGGHGTALGIVRTAFAEEKLAHVWVCETRPRQQGLKLTAYELIKEGLPFSVIADGAASSLMAREMVDCVVVGADRIAANGDTANKIGTYMLAVSASHHRVPFYVAAPSSTLDPETASGESIPIEERSPAELVSVDGREVGPAGVSAYNPAFDVTPGPLISAIVTESGVFRPPYVFCRPGQPGGLDARHVTSPNP